MFVCVLVIKSAVWLCVCLCVRVKMDVCIYWYQCECTSARRLCLFNVRCNEVYHSLPTNQ